MSSVPFTCAIIGSEQRKSRLSPYIPPFLAKTNRGQKKSSFQGEMTKTVKIEAECLWSNCLQSNLDAGNSGYRKISAHSCHAMQSSRKKREALLLVSQGYLQYCGDTSGILDTEILTSLLQQQFFAIINTDQFSSQKWVQYKTKKIRAAFSLLPGLCFIRHCKYI